MYFDAQSEFQVGPPVITEVLQEANVTCAVTIERVLAGADERILITHGTDTMVETAHALAGIPGKTIVLTGSSSNRRGNEAVGAWLFSKESASSRRWPRRFSTLLVNLVAAQTHFAKLLKPAPPSPRSHAHPSAGSAGPDV